MQPATVSDLLTYAVRLQRRAIVRYLDARNAVLDRTEKSISALADDDARRPELHHRLWVARSRLSQIRNNLEQAVSARDVSSLYNSLVIARQHGREEAVNELAPAAKAGKAFLGRKFDAINKEIAKILAERPDANVVEVRARLRDLARREHSVIVAVGSEKGRGGHTVPEIGRQRLNALAKTGKDFPLPPRAVVWRHPRTRTLHTVRAEALRSAVKRLKRRPQRQPDR